MQIDFKKEMLPVSEAKWNQTATLLVEGDVIVPDIKPDIKEILLTEANPVITGQEIVDGKLSITGTATIRILYVSEEETPLPKQMETKFDFKDSLDLPADTLLDLSTKIAAEHIEFSIINSRKINMKIVVSVTAKGYAKQELTLLTDVSEDCPLKIRKKHISAYQVVADTARDIVITEALEVPATKPDIDEIIKLDINALKGDCKIMSGKILLKGSLMINTLFLSRETDNDISHMEHQLAFSEMVDVEGLTDDCLCNVNYEIKNVYYTIKEDVNGEDRLISLDVVLRAEITATRTQEADIIEDCYSTNGQVVLHHEHIQLDDLLGEGVSHENIKEIITIPEGAPSAGAVYSLQCKPKVQAIQVAEENVTITGKLVAFILYASADGENPLYSLVSEFDFQHVVPMDGLDETALCECGVTEQGVSFTLNAAAEIELRCILEFYTRAIRKTETKWLTGCELVEEDNVPKRHGMVIYFVQPADTLWDIAKHYRTDQKKIMELNKLEKNQLFPGQKLLIPSPELS